MEQELLTLMVYLSSPRVITTYIFVLLFTFLFDVVMSATIFSSNNVQLFFTPTCFPRGSFCVICIYLLILLFNTHSISDYIKE